MIDLRFLLAPGNHAARPAANAVGKGALYFCTEHDKIYRSDLSTWTTALTGASALVANQSANQVYAGPTSGGAAAPAFRALVGADMPTVSAVSLATDTTLDVTHQHKLILVDVSGGNVNLTIPAANGAVRGPFTIMSLGGGNSLAVVATGADTFGTSAAGSRNLTDFIAYTIVSDGVSIWFATAIADQSAF